MKKTVQYRFERYEKKYFITPQQQEYLLFLMQSYIKADEFQNYPICNIYYDTDNWQLIRTSIDKPVYKEKLRVRSYGVPKKDDKVYIELKKKYKGVVYKRRISTEAALSEAYLKNRIPSQPYGQIGQEINWFQKTYHSKPKVFIRYDRMAFSGIEDPQLRITFDTNLRWRSTDLDLRIGDFGQPILQDDRILMEIKMPGSCPLWLSSMLAEANIYPTSFSKYGTCYLEHIVKNSNHNYKEDIYCA